MLRHADPTRDGLACAAIYAPFVRESAVSFEEVPPGAQGMAARIREVSATHPWIVAEHDGDVAGFAYGSAHRDRHAYRWAADVSVYVDPVHHRRGLGRMLYGALFALLRRQQLQSVCAGITLPNDASVALHESFGFRAVGVYEGIGWKAGSWRDVGWWQLRLGACRPESAPAEPLGPQTLDSQVPGEG